MIGLRTLINRLDQLHKLALLQNLALYITGGLAQTYPAIPFISGTITIGSATTKVVTIVTPILTIILVVLLMQLFYVAMSLLGNLIIDIVYGFVDPRVRVNK